MISIFLLVALHAYTVLYTQWRRAIYVYWSNGTICDGEYRSDRTEYYAQFHSNHQKSTWTTLEHNVSLPGDSLRRRAALNATGSRKLLDRWHAASRSYSGVTFYSNGSPSNRWLLKPDAKSRFIKRGTAKAQCYEITKDGGTTYSVYQRQIFVLLASSVNSWSIPVISPVSPLGQYLFCFTAAYRKALSPGFLSHQTTGTMGNWVMGTPVRLHGFVERYKSFDRKYRVARPL